MSMLTVIKSRRNIFYENLISARDNNGVLALFFLLRNMHFLGSYNILKRLPQIDGFNTP